jgi:tetratricopeptide (TPR) repeat protein
MRESASGGARGLAAAAVALFAAATIGTLAAEPAGKLEDVQIGERGDVLRVALICTTRCALAPGDGLDFRLIGVAVDLDVDLEGRSALARRLTIARENGASVVRIEAAAPVDEARIVECRAESGPAPCIEYRFGAGETAQSAPAGGAPGLRETASLAPAPFLGALAFEPAPALRETAAGSAVFRLAPIAPAERLTPPIARARLRLAAPFDLKAEAARILGKSFAAAHCEAAKARLIADAWALDAMIDLAFCKAGDGRLDEADADFSRLLTYTPDNYEALVGRGLIAIERGDAARGRQFLQQALNALPPIAESDRIVEAMRRN